MNSILERIEDVVSKSCNSEGIAKRCPNRISEAIYNEIIVPLEKEIKEKDKAMCDIQEFLNTMLIKMNEVREIIGRD